MDNGRINGAAAVSVDVLAEEIVPSKRRRKPIVRGRSESMARLAKRDLYAGAVEYPASINRAHPRPVERGECLQGDNAVRPCPYSTCKYHLAADVNPRTGSIKRNYPDRETWEVPETCALDVADRGGVTLEEVGVYLGVSRERIRQIEDRIITKIRETYPELAEYIEHDRPVTNAEALELLGWDASKGDGR